jgi:hypothetical protein
MSPRDDCPSQTVSDAIAQRSFTFSDLDLNRCSKFSLFLRLMVLLWLSQEYFLFTLVFPWYYHLVCAIEEHHRRLKHNAFRVITTVETEKNKMKTRCFNWFWFMTRTLAWLTQTITLQGASKDPITRKVWLLHCKKSKSNKSFIKAKIICAMAMFLADRGGDFICPGSLASI